MGDAHTIAATASMGAGAAAASSRIRRFIVVRVGEGGSPAQASDWSKRRYGAS